MSARVIAEVDAAGRLVARKRSRDASDARRLRHEADVLVAARHPGVVDLVSCETDGDEVVLTTEFAGTHSLETLGRLDIEQIAGVVAAVATTLADLHDGGVVHGSIEPSHVLIGSGGRPVLCGFGDGRVGTPLSPTPGLGESAAAESTLSPATDVHALGCLLRSLIAADGSADIEPIPEKRFSLARVRPRWNGFHRRAMLTLADRATDELPSRRPPARRLAHELLDTVPNATLQPTAATTSASGTGRRRRQVVELATGGVALTAVMLGVGALWDTRSSAAPGHRSVPIPTTRPSTTTTVPRCASSSSFVTDDLDGDGCGDPVHVEDDRVIVVGTRRFTAGRPGDRVALGDWDCDGTADLALLRPSSGEVFVFDSWATESADVSTPPTKTVPGAVELQARDSGGCSTLVAIRPDGTEEEIQ